MYDSSESHALVQYKCVRTHLHARVPYAWTTALRSSYCLRLCADVHSCGCLVLSFPSSLQALCFSVLQEYFSQAQYVSPMMSLESASSSSSGHPSSRSPKDKRVKRTGRREEPSSSSPFTRTSLYPSTNIAQESDAASGKAGIVETVPDEKSDRTEVNANSQRPHARDDLLSPQPGQELRHNGGNAASFPLDSQFS